MAKPLVVLIPPGDLDALRNADVLPLSRFREMGKESAGDGGEAFVRLWDGVSTDDLPDGEGGPPPPARMLGLPNGLSRFAADRLVAKFFNTFLLHVVFLDGEEAGNPPLHLRDARTVGAEPVFRAARWASLFQRSVEYWFAAEQARTIDHALLVVARGGQVRLTDEDARALREEFSAKGPFKTCYFVDERLEPEVGNDALHSACLWPVLAGRLLLRLLIALSGHGNNDDDVLRPGVHLWQSFECVFDYPVQSMADKVGNALEEAYRKLGSQEERDAVAKAAESFRVEIENEQARTFPGLPMSLTGFGKAAPPKRTDWHDFPAVAIASEKTGDDAVVWGGRVASARADFAKRERDLFREGDPGNVFSPSDVFPDIAEDPRNAALHLSRLNAPGHPADSMAYADVYRKWEQTVARERERQEAKRRLERAGKELSLAQDHYVTAPYGMLVSVAVSLVCGFTLFRALWAVGGSGAVPVALLFAGLSAIGAFSAWRIVSWIHRRSGTRARDQFIDVAAAVDTAMDLRHEAAAKTVREAETQHRRLLRYWSWASLRRLVDRVWRIVVHELQTPTIAAFYRTDDPSPAEAAPCEDAAVNADCEQERADYARLTRFSEVFEDNDIYSTSHAFSDKVLQDACASTGTDSFRELWRDLCKESDRFQRGNLPATRLIPAIRGWLHNLCDRLLDARKRDLLAERTSPRNAAKTQNRTTLFRDGLAAVKALSGYTLATAHVDQQDGPHPVFRCFVPPSDSGLRDDPLARFQNEMARDLSGKVVVTSTPAMRGLRQMAFLFRDIQLGGFARGADGRLGFQPAPDEAVETEATHGKEGPQ